MSLASTTRARASLTSASLDVKPSNIERFASDVTALRGQSTRVRSFCATSGGIAMPRSLMGTCPR